MDVHYFLTDRIAFIRQFFENASQPFVERQRRIRDQEDSFPPQYDESGEPPYLSEWMEAADSLQVIGYLCLSMLAGALELYVKTWAGQLDVGIAHYKQEKGWLNKARAAFSADLLIEFEDAPSDLALIEEVVLARNRIQHPEDISSVQPSYSEADLEKRPHVFFVTDTERELFSRAEGETLSWMFQPTVDVTREKLEIAIEEVEKLADWLEERIRESEL